MSLRRLPTGVGGGTIIVFALLSATVVQAETIPSPWWWQTIDGGKHRTLELSVAWHGRLMVIAWSLLIPIGVVVARFYKVTPNQRFPEQLDNQFWWITHQLLQYTGVIITLIAIYMITGRESMPPSSAAFAHSLAGWTLCGFSLVQILSGWFRGSKGGPININAWPDSPVLAGDHYDLTRRRLIFEFVHTTLGYCTLALAALTTVLGLYASAAPRWMWVILLLWWTVISARYLQLHRRNTHVRTYQAIWGLARNHPGNEN